MHRVEKFHCPLSFYLSLSLLPFSFAFLASLSFSLAGHFLSVGKDLWKTFRIIGLDGRKCRWVVEQDFHSNFRLNVTWFFRVFSGLFDGIVLIRVWFERPIPPTHAPCKSCPWALNLMTSQEVQGTWFCAAGFGQYGSQWYSIRHLMGKLRCFMLKGGSFFQKIVSFA